MRHSHEIGVSDLERGTQKEVKSSPLSLQTLMHSLTITAFSLNRI